MIFFTHDELKTFSATNCSFSGIIAIRIKGYVTFSASMATKANSKNVVPLREALSMEIMINQALIDLPVAKCIVTQEELMAKIEKIRQEKPKTTFKREAKCQITDSPAISVVKFLIKSFHPQTFLQSLVVYAVVQR